MRRLAMLVAAAAALAGCVGPLSSSTSDTPAPVDWAAVGAALAVEHDHADRALHGENAIGLRVLAFSTLSEDGRSLGEYSEVDHARGLVAVTESYDGEASFTLLDAAALPELRVLSRTDDPGAYGDVKLDRHEPLLYHAHPGIGWSFTIWDVSDPTAPARIGLARGEGCHMLSPQRLLGEPHVWCVTLTGPQLYRIVRAPDGAAQGVPVALALPQSEPEVGRYRTYYSDLTPFGPVAVLANHDMTAQDDPLTGAPVLVSAHELQGVRIFDLTAPYAPREVGAWRGEGLDGEMQRVHTAVLAKIGDRRVAFAATETFTRVAPEVYVVDFTDLANPTLLAVWTPPGIPDDAVLRFSAHNLQVVGERLYVANFHAGAWVVDVSDPAAPREVALRTPVRDTEFPGAPGAQLGLGVPFDMNMVWDVVVVNGYVLITDMPAGVEVLAVDGDPHGDPAYASVA